MGVFCFAYKSRGNKILGISQSDFYDLVKKYKVDDYFSELDIDNDDKVWYILEI